MSDFKRNPNQCLNYIFLEGLMNLSALDTLI